MTGLRERKKIRTRERLVAETLHLCEMQGFDATTIDQISAAADVSPRTFHRYFRTKEDVVLAPIDDIVSAMVVALDAQPVTGNEIDALVNAQVMVMTGTGPAGSDDLTHFETMNRITRAAPSVDARRSEKAGELFRGISSKIAERLDLPINDPRVQVVVAVYTSLVEVAMEAWRGQSSAGGANSAAFVESLAVTYENFREIAKNL